MRSSAAKASPSAEEDSESKTWLNKRERGSRFAIRVVFWWATVFGRWPVRQLALLIAFFYTLFDGDTRRWSKQWHQKIHGETGRWRDAYKHILRFTRVAIDRIFLLKGKTKYFQVTRTGNQHLEDQQHSEGGAMLIGAHLGSFEAMRLGGRDENFAINIVGNFENAKMINSLLEKLDPKAAAKVLHIGDDPVGFALNVRKRIEAGEFVAMLADRVGPNDRYVEVEFFGSPARFPTGPFLLAALMKCPVFLVFGLFSEPNRYDLYCEPFCGQLELPRSRRHHALQETVQRFAARLEVYCRKAPDNWFNFYDFWNTGNR